MSAQPYYADDAVTLWNADALELPLEDASVDLVVTSPPYFGLRSYQDACGSCDGDGAVSRPASHGVKVCPDCGNTADRKRCNKCGASMKWPKTQPAAPGSCPECNGTGKGHYAGQIGAEATPAEFVDALIAATAEMVRVLKPSGSIWVNLGDKYASSGGHGAGSTSQRATRSQYVEQIGCAERNETGIAAKSLIGVPWRYAIRCIDELGLILRAEVIWSKPNGLPESVTDRVRRSHETWFHFTVNPRYYSAVDEIREAHADRRDLKGAKDRTDYQWNRDESGLTRQWEPAGARVYNPLGKLPGSVWTIATQPLTVPASLGIDHFAAFPMEWPRRIITGWSPREVCTACGEGRRPTSERTVTRDRGGRKFNVLAPDSTTARLGLESFQTITGYACACPDTTAPTTSGVVLDPFSGTGTTALVAKVLGRRGIGVDLSTDYCRLARWRVNDPGQIASAMQVDKPETPMDDQGVLDFGGAA